jgi:hypothetical protein
MEIADRLSCDLLSDDSYESRKVTNIRVSEAADGAKLSIESKQLGLSETPESSVELNLERVDRTTIERIYGKLGDWLHSDRRDSEEWRTRPVDGEYFDGKKREKVRHLTVKISEEGIKIGGISPSRSPIEGAASIPPAVEIHDETATGLECFYRVYSLLELFLAGQASESGDLFELSGRFVNPEKHLHQKLTNECVTRLESGDYIGVIQKAGETLESYLEQSVPETIEEQANSGTNQAQRAFNNDQDGFLWGYEKAEQEGIRALFEGGFKALRNPASHGRGEESRNRYLDDADQQDAIDALCFVNFLIRKLDEYGQEELEINESDFDL